MKVGIHFETPCIFLETILILDNQFIATNLNHDWKDYKCGMASSRF